MLFSRFSIGVNFFVLALGTLSLGYPQKISSVTSTSILNISTSDYFWYVNDNGEVVQAILRGGPPPAKMADVERDVEFWFYRK